VYADLMKTRVFLLVSVAEAKFRRQVRPNELLRLEIDNLKISNRLVKQRGKAWVGDELAAEAEWFCVPGKEA
jgi:3-hydroxyacyl-[acyl-carrier-protein] dehydratase